MIRKTGGSLLVLSLFIGGCTTAFPIYDGLTTGPPAPGALADLAFLAGCWRGLMPDGTIAEERFSIPGAGSMLGTSRMIQNGHTTSWEFSRITLDEGQIVLRAYPAGTLSDADFRLTDVVQGAQLVFSDPDHDFPRRIRYQLIASDLLQITIDGGEGSDRMESWAVAQAECSA